MPDDLVARGVLIPDRLSEFLAETSGVPSWPQELHKTAQAGASSYV